MGVWCDSRYVMHMWDAMDAEGKGVRQLEECGGSGRGDGPS